MTQEPQQTMLNQLSLVMTIPEDIVKACRQNDLSPAMVETFIRMHNQQVELQKALNEMRNIMTKIVQTIDVQANTSSALHNMITDMHKHVGYGQDEQVASQDIGQGN